jgi:hypothetical protein
MRKFCQSGVTTWLSNSGRSSTPPPASARSMTQIFGPAADRRPSVRHSPTTAQRDVRFRSTTLHESYRQHASSQIVTTPRPLAASLQAREPCWPCIAVASGGAPPNFQRKTWSGGNRHCFLLILTMAPPRDSRRGTKLGSSPIRADRAWQEFGSNSAHQQGATAISSGKLSTHS